MSHHLSVPDIVPELFGESVYLRELTEDDIPFWFERATDAESADLAGDPVPESIEVGHQWLRRHREGFRERKAIRWAIVPTGSSVSVGTVGLTVRSNQKGQAELGIVVARALWGKGMGSAAASLVSCYAFTTLGLSEIHAEVLQRNAGSIRLLEKVGFQLQQVMPATHSEPEVLLQYVLAKRHGAA